MDSLPIWLIPALTLVGGIIIGVILARILQASSPQGAQKQLQELQERFDSYQSEVVSNFGVTAELINKLNQSYQEVQDHLQHSAERLATDDASREQLLACLTHTAQVQISPPDVEPEPAEDGPDTNQTATQEQADEPEPPRDYAPKAEGEPGMLDENYGLKK